MMDESGSLKTVDKLSRQVAALQAIIKQMGEQAAKLAKDGMAAKAQVEALQRERDDAVLLRDHNLRRCEALDSKYKKVLADLDAERERYKLLNVERNAIDDRRHVLHEQLANTIEAAARQEGELAETQALVANLKSHLSALQALVRALPVPEEGGFPIVEVDGDYYVNHTSRFSTKAEADAYTGLLIYRATLDATAPAVCPECNGEGAVDSGGTDPNGNPLMRRCGCREKGGDGE